MIYYLKLGFVLLIIAGIATGVLGFINKKTEPIIEKNKKIAEENARKQVLENAADFDSLGIVNGKTAYAGIDEDGNVIGYTFLAKKYGYSSEVQTMVGINKNNMKIESIKILSQAETPGLGANCTISEKFDGSSWSTKQFMGKSPEKIKVDKDGGKIVSITGATITSRAVTGSIKEGMKKLKEIIPSGGAK